MISGSSSLQTPRRRGRPPGPSKKGEQSREHLYRVALTMFQDKGYEASTLRAIAREAGVSTGLLYRYFPSKQAIVLRLYEELSSEYADRVLEAPVGTWTDRSLYALETSLDVLGPHRETLLSLRSVLIGGGENNLFSPETAASRHRVQGAFRAAVVEASDAPSTELAEALGRLLYTAHLGIILWWMLDQSPKQDATGRLVDALRRKHGWIRMALRMPGVPSMIRTADGLVCDALLGGPERPKA
jgi:AcrR family transcriptional regulator